MFSILKKSVKLTEGNSKLQRIISNPAGFAKIFKIFFRVRETGTIGKEEGTIAVGAKKVPGHSSTEFGGPKIKGEPGNRLV